MTNALSAFCFGSFEQNCLIVGVGGGPGSTGCLMCLVACFLALGFSVFLFLDLNLSWFSNELRVQLRPLRLVRQFDFYRC